MRLRWSHDFAFIFKHFKHCCLLGWIFSDQVLSPHSVILSSCFWHQPETNTGYQIGKLDCGYKLSFLTYTHNCIAVTFHYMWCHKEFIASCTIFRGFCSSFVADFARKLLELLIEWTAKEIHGSCRMCRRFYVGILHVLSWLRSVSSHSKHTPDGFYNALFIKKQSSL